MDNKYVKLTISALLIIYFSLFFFQKINLTTADLGRHIKNGEVFVKEFKVVSSNFYSYTEPDFPVVTHHWLSGVIFYLVELIGGFTGISIFYVLISGLTVFLFFKIAERRSNFWIALFFTVMLLPLMSNRREIRPEGFSYLLLGLYMYVLDLYVSKEIDFKKIAIILGISQVFWVNLHLFFIMGVFVVGVYLAVELYKQRILKKKARVRELLQLLGIVIGASIINPYGLVGLLEPLNIFKEYGYMIIENQPIFFMQKRSPSFTYFYVELLTLFFAIISIHVLTDKAPQRFFSYLIVGLAYLILSYKAIRGIPMFAMYFTPIMAFYVFDKMKNAREKFMIPAIVLLVLSFIPNTYFSFSRPGFGLGLYEGNNRSADFLRDNNVSGPVFNNYDIGGYLIYHFYKQHPVFVDNRPEAYSVSFFKDTYEPAQAKEEVWQALDSERDFNVIYFYRHDATQWAQPFLINRIQDEAWVPVFVDDFVLMLIKNDDRNRDIIDNYRIPNNYFVVS